MTAHFLCALIKKDKSHVLNVSKTSLLYEAIEYLSVKETLEEWSIARTAVLQEHLLIEQL